jgi:hypothetical protein
MHAFLDVLKIASGVFIGLTTYYFIRAGLRRMDRK